MPPLDMTLAYWFLILVTLFVIVGIVIVAIARPRKRSSRLWRGERGLR